MGKSAEYMSKYRSRMNSTGSSSVFQDIDAKEYKDVFMNGTKAQFREVPDGERAKVAERDADYVSQSGSSYWYTDEGVYRSSDHWGEGVASCDWMLDGYDEGDASSFTYHYGKGSHMGFAKWDDFSVKTSAIYDKTKPPFEQYLGDANASISDVARGYITRNGEVYKAKFDRQFRFWTFENR